MGNVSSAVGRHRERDPVLLRLMRQHRQQRGRLSVRAPKIIDRKRHRPLRGDPPQPVAQRRQQLALGQGGPGQVTQFQPPPVAQRKQRRPQPGCLSDDRLGDLQRALMDLARQRSGHAKRPKRCVRGTRAGHDRSLHFGLKHKHIGHPRAAAARRPRDHPAPSPAIASGD